MVKGWKQAMLLNIERNSDFISILDIMENINSIKLKNNLQNFKLDESEEPILRG